MLTTVMRLWLEMVMTSAQYLLLVVL